MRTLLFVLCGVLIGIGAAAAWRSLRDPERGGAERLAADVARLQAENAELARRLAVSPSPSATRPTRAAAGGTAVEAEPAPVAASDPAAAPAGPLPEAETLAGLLDAKDFTALARELERLLLAGEDGFPTILEFLRSGVKPPGYALFQNRRLSMTLLRLAFLHEEEAGQLAGFLLENLDPSSDAALRMQLISLLPGLVATFGDGARDLRAKLEAEVLADFEPGAANPNVWASAQAMRELDLELPAEKLGEILMDPERRQQHWLALQQLAQRGDDEAVDLLLGFVGSSGVSENPSLRQAFYTLGGVDNPRAQDALIRLTSSEDRDTRDAATLAYFSRQKPIGALPIALGYLESDASSQQVQMLLWQLRGNNKEIFEGIRANEESFASAETRKILEAVAAGRPYQQPFPPGAPGAGAVPGAGARSRATQ